MSEDNRGSSYFRVHLCPTKVATISARVRSRAGAHLGATRTVQSPAKEVHCALHLRLFPSNYIGNYESTLLLSARSLSGSSARVTSVQAGERTDGRTDVALSYPANVFFCRWRAGEAGDPRAIDRSRRITPTRQVGRPDRSLTRAERHLR